MEGGLQEEPESCCPRCLSCILQSWMPSDLSDNIIAFSFHLKLQD